MRGVGQLTSQGRPRPSSNQAAQCSAPCLLVALFQPLDRDIIHVSQIVNSIEIQCNEIENTDYNHTSDYGIYNKNLLGLPDPSTLRLFSGFVTFATQHSSDKTPVHQNIC